MDRALKLQTLLFILLLLYHVSESGYRIITSGTQLWLCKQLLHPAAV